MSAIVAINIKRTGSKIVRSVSVNPGEFLRSALCVNCSLIPPSATRILRPMNPPFAQRLQQCVGHDLCSARFRQHFAQNCSQPDYDRDGTKHRADAFLKTADDLQKSHAGAKSDEKRGENERNESV